MNEPLSILIVEDHEISRIGLRISLEQILHFRVVDEALDGLSAVEKSLQLRPQVVLMDIGLPVMDGIEATRKIKENARAVRVLMLTSMNDEDSIFASFAAGADGYVLKTSPMQQLVMALETVGRGDVWIDPSIARHIMNAFGKAAHKLTRSTDADGFGLSNRELEVLELVVQGLSNQEIAEKLSLSAETIKTHVSRVMHKLSVSDRTQAAVKALRKGLISP